MTKGLSIKFKSYKETIPKLLLIIKLDKEIKKHKRIILKPFLRNENSRNTDVSFVEEILKFCLENKEPDSEIFIAEGSDGQETLEVLEKKGYRDLAERYSIGLIDLNTSETEEILDGKFLKFEKIFYPKILSDSFIISLPVLAENNETEMQGALENMLGVFPAKHYKGFFSALKTKIRKWPAKYAIHDILRCKMPQFAVIDASEQGVILAGIPLDMDKQAAKLLNKDWKSISHLRLVDESFSSEPSKISAGSQNLSK